MYTEKNKKMILLFFLVIFIAQSIDLAYSASGEYQMTDLPKEVEDFKKAMLCGNHKDRCPEKITSSCFCHASCEKNAGVKITPDTADGCGGAVNMCVDVGGVCKRECTITGDKPEIEFDDAYCNKEENKCCQRTETCSDVERRLIQCNTICRCPNDCLCDNNNCAMDGSEIEFGQRCDGKRGTENACDNTIFSLDNDYTWEDPCPPGCEWYNDPRCGNKKGLAEALIWDAWLADTIIGEWEQRWRDFWADLGKSMTIEQAGNNICNPKSGFWDSALGQKLGEDYSSLTFGSGDLQAWIGGERAVFNLTAEGDVDYYMYTFSIRLGGFSHENRYNVWLISDGDAKEQVIPKNKSKTWFALGAGETHAGAEYSAVLLSKENHTSLRVNFERVVCDSCSDGRNVCFRGSTSSCENKLCLTDACVCSGRGCEEGGEVYYNCEDCINSFDGTIADVGSNYLGRGEPPKSITKAVPDESDPSDTDSGGW